MNAVRWFIRITSTILVLTAGLVCAVGIIVGTESGTRWALGFAADNAPGRLTVKEPEGTLLSGLELASVEWRNESTAMLAERVLVDMDLLPLLSRRVDVARLEAGSFRLQLGSAASDEGETTPVDVSLPVEIRISAVLIDEISILRDESEYTFSDTAFAVSLVGQQLDVSALRTSGFGLDIDLAGGVQLAGDMPLRLDGRWRQRADEPPGLAGSLQLNGNLSEFFVAHELAAPFGIVSQGTVRQSTAGYELDIDNRWNQLEWTVDGQRLEAGGGTLGLRGTLDSLGIDLDTTARFADYPETRIELDGTTDLVTLEIDRLVAENPWGNGEISGSVTREPTLSAEIDFVLSRVDPSRFVADLSGELAAQGSASLRVDDQGFAISVRGDNIAGTLNDRFVAASTVFDYAPATLNVRYAELRVGRNTLSAAGRIAETVAIDAVFELNAIDELVPAASGAAKATISLRDRRGSPAARIRISGEQLAFGALRTDELLLAIDGSMADHVMDATLVRDGITLDLAAAGRYEQQRWAGTVNSVALDGEDFGRWSSRQAASVAASAESVLIDDLCLVGSGDGTVACATVDHHVGAASEFDISIEGLPVAALPVGMPPGVTVSGTIDGAAQGKFADGALTSEATIRAGNAALAAEYEGEEARVDIAEAVVTASIVDNRLESALTIRLAAETGEIDGSLEAADVLDAGASVSGDVTVSLMDAGLFTVFVPSITNPRGSVAGTFAISGSRDAPAVLGAIELRDGAFSVRPAGIDVSDVNLRAEQLAPGQLRLSGSARSGEGVVSLDGSTYLSADSGIRSELSIQGEDFELLRLPDWRMTTSPEIDIVLDESTAIVTGQLAVPAADITVKAIPESAVRASPDATVHVAGATELRPGRQVDIDVQTRLGDEVNFSGFGLTTGLAGAVRIQGGTQRPYLGFGQVDLVGGRYEAYGQDLTIERGQLIFNGPLADPNLDIRATRTVNDVVAGIQVTGQPSRLSSEVFSEPPLSDADALSYLLTGRPLSGSTTSAEGDLLNKAAFALGMSQAGSIASQIGGALGLETLSVEGGAESGRIVAGKRIGGRLLVEYGYGFVDKLGTLLLRYQVNKRLMLESRTGTVSNLDIVYSVKKQ